MKEKFKNIITKERVIIVILILLIGFGVSYHINRIDKSENKYEAQVKLTEALQDSVKTSENKRGELVSEKKTLQGKLKDLEDENLNLSNNQKELLQRIKETKNHNNIISAALVDAMIKIDSLDGLVVDASEIDTINNTVRFVENDSTSHFQYDLMITGVKPIEITLPSLEFRNIYFPNKQFITFQFDENERKDFPVSFSITNSNKYYKINDIDSYAIPTMQKDIINPSFSQKSWKWMKKNSKYFLIFVGGTAFGIVVTQ